MEKELLSIIENHKELWLDSINILDADHGSGRNLVASDVKVCVEGGSPRYEGGVKYISTVWRDGGRYEGRHPCDAPPVASAWLGGIMWITPQWFNKRVQWWESEENAVGRPTWVAQWHSVHLEVLSSLVHPSGAQCGWVQPFIVQKGRCDPGGSPCHDCLWNMYPPAHLWVTQCWPYCNAAMVHIWYWRRGGVVDIQEHLQNLMVMWPPLLMLYVRTHTQSSQL